MKTNYLFTRLALLVVGISFLTACKKDKEETMSTQEKQELVSTQSTIELLSEIQDINSLVTSLELPGMEGTPTPGGRKAGNKEAECGTTSFSTNTNTGVETITVDYGTGTTCGGKVRKGKIAFSISSNDESMISVAVQFINYESDSKKLSGNYTVGINIESVSENGFTYTYSYIFKDATLAYTDGTKISWSSNYLLTYAVKIIGQKYTFSYTMTGGVSGTDRQSKAFSANITTPINLDINCQYVVTKGTYVIKGADHADATYDFGNGTCDNVATITINGKSTEVAVQD